MKVTLNEALRCPVCKGTLNVETQEVMDGLIFEGNMTCESCKRQFQIQKGIPRLYIADNQIIERADQSKFSEFIITPQRISALIKKNGPTSRIFPLSYRKMSVLMVSGWLSILIAFFLTVFVSFAPSIFLNFKILLLPFLLISFALFLADFLIYRRAAKAIHFERLHDLYELLAKNRLSEYDNRLEIHDKKELFEDIHEEPRSEEIARVLNKYNFHGGYGLNIGCGGASHQSISWPFFNHGYDMIGVDISEDYLLEYKQIFNTDAIQANAMALPFGDKTFDIVSYCEILEHLHHPFLGLCEVNRVLKENGIIILSTNYRCRLTNECINPFIAIERILSLYWDKILGPRDILRRFGKMAFYHTEFSKSEITKLFESSGFDLFEFHTYFAKWKMLSKLFKRIPVLRFTGGSILVIASKKSDIITRAIENEV